MFCMSAAAAAFDDVMSQRHLVLLVWVCLLVAQINPTGKLALTSTPL